MTIGFTKASAPKWKVRSVFVEIHCPVVNVLGGFIELGVGEYLKHYIVSEL